MLLYGMPPYLYASLWREKRDFVAEFIPPKAGLLAMTENSNFSEVSAVHLLNEVSRVFVQTAPDQGAVVV